MKRSIKATRSDHIDNNQQDKKRKISDNSMEREATEVTQPENGLLDPREKVKEEEMSQQIEQMNSLKSFLETRYKKDAKYPKFVKANIKSMGAHFENLQNTRNRKLNISTFGRAGVGKTFVVAELLGLEQNTLIPSHGRASGGVTQVPYAVEYGKKLSLTRIYCSQQEFVDACIEVEVSEKMYQPQVERCKDLFEKEEEVAVKDEQAIKDILEDTLPPPEKRLQILYYLITVPEPANSKITFKNVRIFDLMGVTEDGTDRAAFCFNRRIFKSEKIALDIILVFSTERSELSERHVQDLNECAAFCDRITSVPPVLIPFGNEKEGIDPKTDSLADVCFRRGQLTFQKSIERFFGRDFRPTVQDQSTSTNSNTAQESVSTVQHQTQQRHGTIENIETLYNMYQKVQGYVFASNWPSVEDKFQTNADPSLITEYETVSQYELMYITSKKLPKNLPKVKMTIDFAEPRSTDVPGWESSRRVKLLFTDKDGEILLQMFVENIIEIGLNKSVWSEAFAKRGKKDYCFSIKYKDEMNNSEKIAHFQHKGEQKVRVNIDCDLVKVIDSLQAFTRTYYYNLHQYFDFVCKQRVQELKEDYVLKFWTAAKRAGLGVKIALMGLTKISKNAIKEIRSCVPEVTENIPEIDENLILENLWESCFFEGDVGLILKKHIIEYINLTKFSLAKNFLGIFNFNAQKVVNETNQNTELRKLIDIVQENILLLDDSINEENVSWETDAEELLNRNQQINSWIAELEQKKDELLEGYEFIEISEKHSIGSFLRDIIHKETKEQLEFWDNLLKGAELREPSKGEKTNNEYTANAIVWDLSVKFQKYKELLEKAARASVSQTTLFKRIYKTNLAQKCELLVSRDMTKIKPFKRQFQHRTDLYAGMVSINTHTTNVTTSTNKITTQIFLQPRGKSEKFSKEGMTIQFLVPPKVEELLQKWKEDYSVEDIAPRFYVTKITGRGKHKKTGNECWDVLNYHLKDENYVGCPPNLAQKQLVFLVVEPNEFEDIHRFVDRELSNIEAQRKKNADRYKKNEKEISQLSKDNIFYLEHPYDDMKIGRARQTVLLFAQQFNLPRFFMIDDDIERFEEYYKFKFQRIPYAESNMYRSLKFAQRVLEYELELSLCYDLNSIASMKTVEKEKAIQNSSSDNKTSLLKWLDDKNRLGVPKLLAEIRNGLETKLSKILEECPPEDTHMSSTIEESYNSVQNMASDWAKSIKPKNMDLFKFYEALQKLYLIVTPDGQDSNELPVIRQCTQLYQSTIRDFALRYAQVSLINNSINALSGLEKKCETDPYESHSLGTKMHACVLFNGVAVNNLYYVTPETYAGLNISKIGNLEEESEIETDKTNRIISVSTKRYYQEYLSIRKTPNPNATGAEGRKQDLVDKLRKYFEYYGLQFNLSKPKKRGKNEVDQACDDLLREVKQQDGYDHEDNFFTKMAGESGRINFQGFRHAFKCGTKATSSSHFW